MKSNLKSILFLTLSLTCLTNVLAQEKNPPLLEIINSKMDSQKRMQTIDQKVASTEKTEVKTDSVLSTNETPSNQTVIRTVYEGSNNLNETSTLKYAGEEKVTRIGNGSFKNILYTDKSNNQVIKVKHLSTMEYMYELEGGEKANTERLEISIYYENEQPYYAIFKEDHYKNASELFFCNEYRMQMATYHKDMFFTNDFQKAIYKYILDTSASILKQK